MAWGKSRHEQGRAADPITADSSRLADRVLTTLIAQTEQINARLTLLEDRFDASMVAATKSPGQADLNDLRAHTERLASELAAVSEALLNDDAAEPVLDLTEPANEPAFDQTVRLNRPQGTGWQPRPD